MGASTLAGAARSRLRVGGLGRGCGRNGWRHRLDLRSLELGGRRKAGDQFIGRLFALGVVVPAGDDDAEQRERGKHARNHGAPETPSSNLRHVPLGVRGRRELHRIAAARGLQSGQQRSGVDLEQTGIVTQETPREGVARQLIETPGFERLDLAWIELQGIRDFGDAEPLGLTGAPQGVAGGKLLG